MKNKLRDVCHCSMISALVLLTAGNACGASRKNLTPATAKALLQEFIKTHHTDVFLNGEVLLDYSAIVPLLECKTFAYYKHDAATGTSNTAVFRRLLDAGLLQQAVERNTYPSPAGTYEDIAIVKSQPNRRSRRQSSEPSAPPSPAPGFHPLVLTVRQGSIAGTFRHVINLLRDGSHVCDGTVTGTFTLDGKINLTFEGSTSVHIDENGHSEPEPIREGYNCGTPPSGKFQFQKNDSGFSLVGSYNSYGYAPGEVTLQGNGSTSPDTVDVVAYMYHLSPPFTKASVQGFFVVAAGPVEIDSVDNLMLDGDTAAEGQYKWHATLNDIGRALTGSLKRDGMGRVLFRKQPDGGWVCAETQ
jgi:hypothetical protein